MSCEEEQRRAKKEATKRLANGQLFSALQSNGLRVQTAQMYMKFNAIALNHNDDRLKATDS